MGLDCWGLVRLVYAERFGIKLPAFADDYDDTNDGQAIAGIYAVERTEWVERPGPAPGDVVMFRIIGIPLHVGVVIDAQTFLHTMARRETCVERLTSPAWSARVLAYYR
ncbi:MAG: C40 family peptidase, partial [Phycisphaerales bacterium]|nr:C40 family peptidase [Phycisphaerales bacterium]